LIDTQVLVTGSVGVNAFKIGEPAAAAKLPAATAHAAYFTGFLPGTYLAHFYLYPKLTCIYLYQFPKIHPVVGNIKEGSLAPIGL
jgi:hypothetical protein